MQKRFISFQASAVDPVKLKAVCSRYFEYENARTIRSMVIRRMLIFVAVMSALTVGFRALPLAALLLAAALAAGGVAIAVTDEMKTRRRLAQELRDVPTAEMPVRDGGGAE